MDSTQTQPVDIDWTNLVIYMIPEDCDQKDNIRNIYYFYPLSYNKITSDYLYLHPDLNYHIRAI